MILEKGKEEGGRQRGKEEKNSRHRSKEKMRTRPKSAARLRAFRPPRLPRAVAMATEHYGGVRWALPSRARARKALGEDRSSRSSLAARRGPRLQRIQASLCQVAKSAFNAFY